MGWGGGVIALIIDFAKMRKVTGNVPLLFKHLRLL